VCHHCRHEAPIPAACTACGAPGVRAIGAGTQRIEEVVGRAFPGAHVARMDSDATLARGSHEEILDRFRRGEIQVLVGTQMLAKGLDVPEVTVVGVVDADGALHVPEYHSAERTFQLVAQVAGRAGRGPKGGEVLVQTSSPEHPAIVCAARHDFESFARGELEERAALRYPPFTRFVRVLVEARSPDAARREAEALAASFRGAAAGVDVLGARPAPLERVRGRWRWHFLLRCDPPSAVVRLRDRLLETALRPARGGAQVSVDVDPATTL
jgi:primosomal protein N' (replication factor Y)